MLSRAAVNSARASLKRIEIISQDVKNLYDNGLADSVDILDAELALQKAQRMVHEKNTLSSNALLQLNRLTGLDSQAMPVISDSVPVPDMTRYENHVIGEDDVQRPELAALHSKWQASKRTSDLRKADYYPSLSGFGGYSYGRPNRDLFYKTWNDYWTVGLNLNWEFNLAGQTANKVKAAQESASAIEMSKNDLAEALILQSRTALENLRLAYHDYILARDEYDIINHQFQLAQNKERAGLLSVNRLLELESELAAAEQFLKSSEINFYIVETELFYATGSSKIYGGL